MSKLKSLALFALIALSLASLATAPPTPTTRPTDRDRTARPGDQLIVYIFELQTPGLWWAKILDIDANGNIEIPNLGQVQVANLLAIEQKIVDTALNRMQLLSLRPGTPGPEVNIVLIPDPARSTHQPVQKSAN